LRHMLLASLARFRHWVVIDSGYSAAAAASLEGELYAYALHIAAVDAAERTGLNVKLVEAKSKRVVWSEFLFVGRDDWPTVGERIVRGLAANFDIYLSADRLQRAQNIEHANIVAFDRWMKGVFLLEKFEPDAEGEAERHFRDVIVMSPEFGPAYASLAGIYNSRHIVFPGIRRNHEREEYALRLAQKAVDLEPLDARCHVTVGWSMALTRRFRPAELAFELAEELNPSDPALLMSAAHGAAICGNVQVAKERARRAIDTHPYPSQFFHAIQSHIHFQEGDYRRCVDEAEKGGEFLTPLFGWKAAAHAFLGEVPEAREAAKRLIMAARQSWRATGAADERSITEWFLDIFPFSNEEKRQKLQEGLAIAGLPAFADSKLPTQRQKPRV
jgi:tetratricopeptide (TPR) repeat protein